MELTKEDYQGQRVAIEQGLKQAVMSQEINTEILKYLDRKIRRTKSGIKKK